MDETDAVQEVVSQRTIITFKSPRAPATTDNGVYQTDMSHAI